MRKFLIAFLLCTAVVAQGTADLFLDSFSWSIVGKERVACVVVLANTGRLETLNHVMRLEFYDQESKVIASRSVSIPGRVSPGGKRKFDVSVVVPGDIVQDTATLKAVMMRCDTGSL